MNPPVFPTKIRYWTFSERERERERESILDREGPKTHKNTSSHDSPTRCIGVSVPRNQLFYNCCFCRQVHNSLPLRRLEGEKPNHEKRPETLASSSPEDCRRANNTAKKKKDEKKVKFTTTLFLLSSWSCS
jgi:hypothetical protein